MYSWRVSHTRRRGMVTKSQMRKKRVIKIEGTMCAKVLRQENKQRSVRTKQEGKVMERNLEWMPSDLHCKRSFWLWCQ